MKEEIELLTFLIEKWDNEHNSFDDIDPVQLLKSLMNDRNMKPVSLAELLGVSKGLVSDILNYKKGLSKEIIRKLADTFKLSHEAFNRHYDLVASVNAQAHSFRKSIFRKKSCSLVHFDYQDIRDDRVYTYFNMNENETLTYYIQLNAAYLGKYFLPGTYCGAMYDNTINTVKIMLLILII